MNRIWVLKKLYYSSNTVGSLLHIDSIRFAIWRNSLVRISLLIKITGAVGPRLSDLSSTLTVKLK